MSEEEQSLSLPQWIYKQSMLTPYSQHKIDSIEFLLTKQEYKFVE